MSRFMPNLILNSILEIDQKTLDTLGVKAVILDVDNTLTCHNNQTPADGVVEWIAKMRGKHISLVIVSNNSNERVRPFANLLGLDFEAWSCKPFRFGLVRAIKRLGLDPSQIAIVGDQIFTDVWGGNKKGLKTILVSPFQNEHDLISRLKRHLEKKYIDRYHKSNR